MTSKNTNKSNNINILAVDFGERRTGLAYHDIQTGVVLPLNALVGDLGDIEKKLLQELGQRKPSLLLFGIPLSEDASLNPQSERVLRFARRVQRRAISTLRIELIDEYGSSEQAHQEILRAGSSYRNAATGTLDSNVAAQLLREYIELNGQGAKKLEVYLSELDIRESLAKKGKANK